jgi:hypothetical protein
MSAIDTVGHFICGCARMESSDRSLQIIHSKASPFACCQDLRRGGCRDQDST